jgi:serine/threonine protein kinase
MWSIGVIIYILLGGYPPFHDEDQNELFKRIKAGVYEFHAEYWSSVSEEAKDLIRKLLTVNPLERLTAQQALGHPWLLSDEEKLSELALSGAQAEIKKFQARKRFKKGVNAIKAINRMKSILGGLGKARSAIEAENSAGAAAEAGESSSSSSKDAAPASDAAAVTDAAAAVVGAEIDAAAAAAAATAAAVAQAEADMAEGLKDDTRL